MAFLPCSRPGCQSQAALSSRVYNPHICCRTPKVKGSAQDGASSMGYRLFPLSLWLWDQQGTGDYMATQRKEMCSELEDIGFQICYPRHFVWNIHLSWGIFRVTMLLSWFHSCWGLFDVSDDAVLLIKDTDAETALIRIHVSCNI